MRNIINIVLAIFMLFFTACSGDIKVVSHADVVPLIVPDYKDVTIPCNIAPLSFSVDGLSDAALLVEGKHGRICMTTTDGTFNLPSDEWEELLSEEKGGSLKVTICRPADGGWQALKPFKIDIARDSVDGWLVYRRIQPGYGLWNEMGIYQRDLSTYEERPVYTNRNGKGNCMNCHSFQEGSSDRWQIHVRKNYGGTYIVNGDEISRLKLDGTEKGKPVYCNWHPQGRFIAYSTNNTFFMIHTADKNRWEVMDDGSDLMVVDTETGEVLRSPLFASDDTYETFPCFSPDGKWLYYCAAKAPEQLVKDFSKVQYSICRIAFDEQKKSFGEQVDTVYNANSQGGSASMPRISPDGRWLCFVHASYGNFGVCHRDADLWMVDLQTGKAGPMTQANSNQMDSFHSWSRNSRWLVFSSKRDDAIYTRLFFTHVDENGPCSKAFVLPQKDAAHYYDMLMDAYNIPELITSPINLSPQKIQRRLEELKDQ